jgi:hypothetical protein
LIVVSLAAVAGLIVADGFTLAAGRHDVTAQIKAAQEGKRIAAYVKLLRERKLEEERGSETHQPVQPGKQVVPSAGR